jgi:hypothetical protein
MRQTTEEHHKNYNEKIYHLQCLIPVNRSWQWEPVDVYYRTDNWCRYGGYRKAKQALMAIKSMRKNNVTTWGYPWKWRIKIISNKNK